MSNIEKICTGCGRSSLNPIGEQHAACCPDNNYVNISSTYFLYEKLYDSFDKYSQGKFTLEEYLKNNWLVYEQAKAMHKEEIIEAVNFADNDPLHGIDAEQYYNETFGGNNEQQ